MAVCDRHDFTAFSSASRADSSAPFFAELKLASMKVSDRSILPRSRKSSASACSARVSSPSAATLETPMAGLIGRILRREIVPRSAGAQNPKNAMQHRSAYRAKADPARRTVASAETLV